MHRARFVTREKTLSTIFRYFLFVVGLCIILPLIGFLFLVPGTPTSLVGMLYLLSYFFIVVGMLCAPWQPGRSSAFIFAGSALVFAVLAARILFPPSGTQINMITLPSQRGPRLVNRILNEQDVVLFGTQVAPYLGAVSPSERKSLDSKFSQTFNEMARQGSSFFMVLAAISLCNVG